MRHIHDRLERTHTFVLTEDEAQEQISFWGGSELVEPGLEVVRRHMLNNRHLFMSQLSQARRQRMKNHMKRFGVPMPLPQRYIVQKGMMTQEERERIMNAPPFSVVEVSCDPSEIRMLP